MDIGILQNQTTKNIDQRVELYSPNWCNPTTYRTLILEEQADNISAEYSYGDLKLVDMYVDNVPVVYSFQTTKAIFEIYNETTGEKLYAFNVDGKKITIFNNKKTINTTDVIKVSYEYLNPTSSMWQIIPKLGKWFRIEYGEMLIDKDANLSDYKGGRGGVHFKFYGTIPKMILGPINSDVGIVTTSPVVNDNTADTANIGKLYCLSNTTSNDAIYYIATASPNTSYTLYDLNQVDLSSKGTPFVASHTITVSGRVVDPTGSIVDTPLASRKYYSEECLIKNCTERTQLHQEHDAVRIGGMDFDLLVYRWDMKYSVYANAVDLHRSQGYTIAKGKYGEYGSADLVNYTTKLFCVRVWLDGSERIMKDYGDEGRAVKIKIVNGSAYVYDSRATSDDVGDRYELIESKDDDGKYIIKSVSVGVYYELEEEDGAAWTASSANDPNESESWGWGYKTATRTIGLTSGEETITDSSASTADIGKLYELKNTTSDDAWYVITSAVTTTSYTLQKENGTPFSAGTTESNKRGYLRGTPAKFAVAKLAVEEFDEELITTNG